DWKAAGPLAWSTLRPSGSSVCLRAMATRWAVTIAACRSTTWASKMVAACALLRTRQCPALSGLMSMIQIVRSSSKTFIAGVRPGDVVDRDRSLGDAEPPLAREREHRVAGDAWQDGALAQGRRDHLVTDPQHDVHRADLVDVLPFASVEPEHLGEPRVLGLLGRVQARGVIHAGLR